MPIQGESTWHQFENSKTKLCGNRMAGAEAEEITHPVPGVSCKDCLFLYVRLSPNYDFYL